MASARSLFARFRPPSIYVRALLHGAAWLLIFGLNMPFFARIDLTSPVLHAVAGLALLAVYYYLHTGWLVPQVFERGRPVRYLVLAVAVGAGLAALRMGIETWWFDDELMHVFPTPLRYRFYTASMFSTAGTAAFLMSLLRARRRAELREQELIRHQQESQLLHLRAQINPHFLFNTLNNIYALSLSGSPQAPDAVLRLAGLLRYAIYSTRHPTVAVAEEAAQIEQLLDLYRLRFATPPDLQLTVTDAAAGRVRLEPMLLIPIVENCLKHGDLGQHPAAFVHLRLGLDEATRELVFVAENSYDPADHAKDDTPGVGLVNIRRRLALIYPHAAATLHTHADGPRFRAELRLPIGAENQQLPATSFPAS